MGRDENFSLEGIRIPYYPCINTGQGNENVSPARRGKVLEYSTPTYLVVIPKGCICIVGLVNIYYSIFYNKYI